MGSHPSTNQIAVNSAWASMIRREFPLAPNDFDPGYFVLSIKDSSCEQEEPTKSKYNLLHAKAVISLCIKNYEANGYSGKDMWILTPYTA
ncbi:hypothetical protein BDW74DRAFT_157680 [Aspergillus multicolor]|uniref:uncharacterized protein n=1 Tax=Aspergillus multicolor TaxID=41759 RepID=UPI003CCD5AB4